MKFVESITRCFYSFAVLAVLTGCFSSEVGRQRVSRYEPDTGNRRPWTWEDAEEGGSSGPTTGGNDGMTKKILKNGDRLEIYLRGIPVPDKIISSINVLGEVTLPYIGETKIIGLTIAEAQTKIKQSYIDKQIFKSVDVIILPQLDKYFVTGEVKRPGEFPLAGELSLRMAIATAGGPTEFANLKKVELTRQGKTIKYDIRAIKDGRIEDPLVERGDIISVPEAW